MFTVDVKQQYNNNNIPVPKSYLFQKSKQEYIQYNNIPVPKSYLFQKSKQEYRQVNI